MFKTVGLADYNQEAFSRLTSRDPNKFWTSGQWMTERKGGSDVGKSKPIIFLNISLYINININVCFFKANGTETIALQQSNNMYKLFGYKWFSSATDSDITITLAKIPDQKHGNVCF